MGFKIEERYCIKMRRVDVSNGTSDLRGCVKVELAVLGSPSLISLMVSVNAKQCST